jgi:hypothetical protein
MTQHTGENEQALTRIMDMIRMASIVILLLHFYSYQYPSFLDWQLTSRFSEALLANIRRTGLLDPPLKAQLFALVLLGVSLLGARGKKDPAISPGAGLRMTMAGLGLFFGSHLLLLLDFPATHLAVLYILATSAGFILVLNGGNKISRTLLRRATPDIFNRRGETFPQQEEKIENAYSVHFPARYRLQDEMRDSWINIVNPFSSTLILGYPGTGKTYFLIRPLIKQQIQKGYAMLVFDFKYDDLSKMTYNYFLQCRRSYSRKAAFYNIAFANLDRSHRCNCLHPRTLGSLTDAMESARTMLLGLNKEWIGKQGDFFVESSINLVTALIWFLRNYEDGQYCSWPHVIELVQIHYKELFTVLADYPQIQALVNPFINAYRHGAADQLEGQVASATISLGRLASQEIYWVLTGDDFTLDLNNPESPKVLTLGSSPEKANTYGAIISVFINAINRVVNRKGGIPFGEVLDEFSCIMPNQIDKVIATGRSNKIAITMAVQDSSQLKLAYGKDFAEVIVNLCGNIISGQVSGETARLLSVRFGKTMQERESVSISGSDTNVTQSRQLADAIPVSRVSTLSSGEFVGLVSDTPNQRIVQKIFCCEVANDQEAMAQEEAAFQELPFVQAVTPDMLSANFLQVKKDIAQVMMVELGRIGFSAEM